GFVMNTRRGVVIEVEGAPAAIDGFGRRLLGEAPPLARIDSIAAVVVSPTGGESFEIAASDEPGSPETLFPVDTAVCDDCLCEMRDPGDRRFRYPFINCTNCGPRFTIIEGLPYDRPLTTMSGFVMDRFCNSQYTDPHDRRFHAEPVSCPACGPRLRLIDPAGAEMQGDPVRVAQRLLAEGRIVAIKGLGGYHLACLANDRNAVLRLRERKRRPAKPFALMFRDLGAVKEHCLVDDVERRLLSSPEAPIVLLRRAGSGLPDELAPRNGYIGAMLPYTPLHHLIMEAFDVLVMTSANFTDEPLISNEEELSGILATVADAALVHDRRIAHKCDDSILFAPAGTVIPVRRARGFVPEPIPLVHASHGAILAVGGQEKGTFAVSKGGAAVLSPHLGDLGDIRSQRNFRSELEDFLAILSVVPEAVAHDLHPDYFTSRLAAELDVGVRIAVQHHHAHAVSVMVEHGLAEPVVAVCFDGTGFGADGNLWGGEFLLARYADFERIAHVKYLPLPGGEAAIREPWRMGLVHLWNAFGAGVLDLDLPAPCSLTGLPAGEVLGLARRGINAPLSSGIGRLFDAVAFILGCGERVTYEAEAAVALEALALGGDAGNRLYRFDTKDDTMCIIDPAPVVRDIVKELRAGVAPQDIAAAFHASVAVLIVELSAGLTRRYGAGAVVCSGGVFQNRLLCEEIVRRSGSLPVPLYQHEIAPPNDGGISLGQLQVAAARIGRGMV
ncbi:MAG TPA: carbamoyltransferase HypF, partial [Patescibacteria group bacterium]|nr:carbamoyltransferase HypF [Patescibacteria group bacterium]